MDMLTYLKDIIDLTPFTQTEAVGGVRYNPLKLTRERFLELFEGDVEPARYFEGGYKLVSEKEGLGNSPLHMAGGCYFQEPSAMSAVTAMQIQNGDRVLDLCAAPGSKATALAALNPDGITVANEIHPARAKILMSNMERLGIYRALITRSDAAGLANNFEGYFDKILLDAPCSGEGMFRKYPEILTDWTEELVQMCARRSRELLEHAAHMLRPGGRLVYSTCTFNLEENEKNILDFLACHPEFEPVQSGIPNAQSGRMGLDRAVRIFPDAHGEGHFVCALQKSEQAATAYQQTEYFKADKPNEQLTTLLEGCVEMSVFGDYVLHTAGQNVYLIPADVPRPKGVQILRAGVQAALLKGKTYIPCHHLYTAAPTGAIRQSITVDDVGAGRFYKGETLPCNGKGFTAVMWQGLCIGFGKAVDGTLKNYFPKGLRKI